MITGILLGAGASRRLGRPKQTLPFGDTTLLGWTLRQAEESSLERIVLVVGGAADEVLGVVTPDRALVVRNDSYGAGCASSLLAGLDAAEPCDAVMLLLGDMPGVDASVIDTVRQDWERHRPWGAVTSYRGSLGHPFVFAAQAFPTLRGLHGDKAVWKLVDGQPAPERSIRRVPIDRRLPADIDTWDDYRDALAAHVAVAGTTG
jgi:molybdenum cofactor cytidylyltransferase